ncbi:hypothetical protein [Hyunsoonleella rubra]|uniref:Transmembrane protein n=1 Tax=Hyunsoonleella rubra TaxID=1737062 RepID=A0ABW5TB90_9FLAO
MHKLTAIFFVMLYMLAMLRPVQPYVEYVLNQDYIAEFLCINKDKPKLQCNGKCYLAKQLEKQQEQEPFSSLSISLENYPIGFVEILNIDVSIGIAQSEKPTNTPYQKLYYFDYNYSAFQPPDIV